MSVARLAPAPASALLLGAMIGSLVAGRMETALLCLLSAAVVAASSGAPIPALGWWRPTATAAVVAWTLNLYLVAGEPIAWAALGPLVPTLEGARLGALFALRLVGAAVAFHGLRHVWPGERAADEAARILAPLQRAGVPVGEARVMVGLALRFAPLLAAESDRIRRLQDLRAGRPPRGLGERLERRRAAAVPSLVHALERAEQVALALEARHYRLRPPPRGGPGWAWSVLGLLLPGVSLLWRGM